MSITAISGRPNPAITQVRSKDHDALFENVFAPCVCVSDRYLALAQNKKEIPASDVISRSIKAVGYEVGGGATKIIFLGTSAAPNASGEAKVEAKKGGTDIDLKVKSLPQPTTLGAEFLTYVCGPSPRMAPPITWEKFPSIRMGMAN